MKNQGPRAWGSRFQLNTGKVFAYFLSYYGEYFDVESQAIFFLCNNTPIIVPKLNGAPTSPYNKTL